MGDNAPLNIQRIDEHQFYGISIYRLYHFIRKIMMGDIKH